MKEPLIIMSLVVAALVVGIIVLHSGAPAGVAPPVKLAITGPEGQQFTGTYVADGATNAVVPATIRLRAKRATYEFQPAMPDRSFGSRWMWADRHRTSFVSYNGKSVRGGWRYWGSGESAW